MGDFKDLRNLPTKVWNNENAMRSFASSIYACWMETRGSPGRRSEISCKVDLEHVLGTGAEIYRKKKDAMIGNGIRTLRRLVGRADGAMNYPRLRWK